MKLSYRIFLVFLVVLLLGCQKQQQTLTAAEKEAIRKEVKSRFNDLIFAINQRDAVAWSKYYSNDDFVSAIVSTDYYASRTVFVDSITTFFSKRERQHVEPLEIRVFELAPDLALLTSEEKAEMLARSGKLIKAKHVFTMVWKKEPDGWKIVHSHESWVDEKTN